MERTVDILTRDHEILATHVARVAALLGGMVAGEYAPHTARTELSQQAQLLHDELNEHFQLEEEATFPALLEMVPDQAEAVERLSRAHDRILGCMVQVLQRTRALTDESLLQRLSDTTEAYRRFEVEFIRHVDDEGSLLNSALSQLGPEQLRRLAAVSRGTLRACRPRLVHFLRTGRGGDPMAPFRPSVSSRPLLY